MKTKIFKSKICPICGAELETGNILCKPNTAFVPDYSPTPLLTITNKSKEKHKYIIFSEDFWHTGRRSITTYAYACRNCKIVIYPYEQ